MRRSQFAVTLVPYRLSIIVRYYLYAGFIIIGAIGAATVAGWLGLTHIASSIKDGMKGMSSAVSKIDQPLERIIQRHRASVFTGAERIVNGAVDRSILAG